MKARDCKVTEREEVTMGECWAVKEREEFVRVCRKGNKGMCMKLENSSEIKGG